MAKKDVLVRPVSTPRYGVQYKGSFLIIIIIFFFIIIWYKCERIIQIEVNENYENSAWGGNLTRALLQCKVSQQCKTIEEEKR